MTLVAAAVCPHPPLLAPEVAAGAAPELDPLRDACRAALDAVAAAYPDLLVVVGTGPARTSFAATACGSLAGYGVPLCVPLSGADCTEPPTLPLSLTIGAWLLAFAGWQGERVAEAVPTDLPADECAALGRALAARAGRVALLVMGDASARRTEKAPGYVDPRAEPFDAAVADALARPEPAALLALDPRLAADLLAAGRAPWQVLAGAAGDDVLTARLSYDDAPYGVGYVVARWAAGKGT